MLAGFFIAPHMDTNNYNNAIEQQAVRLELDIKANASRFNIRHRTNSPSPSSSVRKIKSKTSLKEGFVNRVGVSFPRSLIYTHTGSGKGKGGLIGSRWKNKFGETVKTNPRSLGKAGTGGRKAKPFIDEALSGPEGVNKIAEIAAVELGAAISGNLFIDKNNIGKK